MTNHTKYPTKEEILAELYELSDETYKTIRKWKKMYFDGKWKDADELTKFHCLQELIARICVSLEYPQPIFETRQQEWHYVSGEFEGGIIVGEIGKPSIISTLHELGHHIFGESELKACQFSTSIFMKCFPNSYKKLIWDGHMLKKPND